MKTPTTPDEKVQQSKDWRKRLDAILQEMKEQQRSEARGEDTRHLALSITHTEDAVMRQGMRMKAINETNPGAAPNPYPQSYNPDNAQVEPTADGIKL